MKERPILFSAPMIRALLAGTKSQTRRVVKGSPVNVVRFIGADDLPTGEFGLCDTHDRFINRNTRCPYGVPGDRLWVRESGLEHRQVRLFTHDATPGKWWTDEDGGRYGATYSAAITRQSLLRTHRIRPSIHMPRWASRLTLEITDVRVERLTGISEADARAEGLQVKNQEFMPSYRGADKLPWRPEFPRDAYEDLWEEINGAGSWDANPWVWAVTFKQVTP